MPNFPAQPTIFDTTYAAPTGGVTTVHSGGNLQAAIDAASPNSIIQIDAGITLGGPFILRNKGANTAWIYIQSTNYASLPAPGHRVAPSDAANMPTLSAGSTNAVFTCEAGANHYRLVGLEIASTNTDQSVSGQNLILIEAPFPGNQSLSDVPDHIFVDRCYVHGTTTGNCRRGIAMQGSFVAVVDAYISEIHEVGFDNQALAAWNGPGPFMITNDYLEASGENVLFGGADPLIANLVPSDILFGDCRFNKQLRWYPNDPTYAGIHWGVKNIFELKNAQRVLVGGCIMDYNWADAQNGYSILFTVRNQGGTAPWSTVQDVTFQNNIVRHVGGGFNITGTDNLQTSLSAARIWIRKNQFFDINTSWSAVPGFGAVGRAIQVGTSPSAPADLTIEHNTLLSNNPGLNFTNFDNSATFYAAPRFIYQNNISDTGVFGDFGTGSDATALGTWVPGYVFVGNVISGGTSATLPAGNFVSVNDAGIGFIDLTNGVLGLTPTSPFKGLATDGQDPGAVQAPLLGRGAFGNTPAYQTPYRIEASMLHGPTTVTPTPPSIAFATTPTPTRRPVPLEPSRDASVCFLPTRASALVSTMLQHPFIQTDIPVAPYHTMIAMIRGRSSGVNIPPLPPPVLFTDTDPAQYGRPIPDASIYYTTPGPIILQFDPLAAGAFLMTPVAWRGGFRAIDASDLFAPPVPAGPSVPVYQRMFPVVWFYRTPYLQDSSRYVVTPATFGAVAPPVPNQLIRFLSHEWAARLRGATYLTDASLWLPPQALIRIVAPPVGGQRRTAANMRRRELLNIRPAPNWMPRVDE